MSENKPARENDGEMEEGREDGREGGRERERARAREGGGGEKEREGGREREEGGRCVVCMCGAETAIETERFGVYVRVHERVR
jgi:hypothetical protein